MRSVSREEMRSIDACAIDALGVPGVVLMENAGRRSADGVDELLDKVGGDSVAVVAGTGNNGGDGFVVARHMMICGRTCAVFLAADPEKLSGDAAVNFRILQSLDADVRVLFEDELNGLAERLREFDVVVDAVGGTGIRGALRGAMAAATEGINAAGRPVVAIDIPTGLDCDTGRAEGTCVKATRTVTMACRKKGFDADGAAAYTGEVIVADIGIPVERVARRAGVI